MSVANFFNRTFKYLHVCEVKIYNLQTLKIFLFLVACEMLEVYTVYSMWLDRFCWL